MAQSSKPPTAGDVSSAEQTLSEARTALERERKRIQVTNDQVTAISKVIASTDPDDVGAFADLVRERDTLRGLLEALALRETNAVAAVDDATRALSQARADALAAEVAHLEAEIAKADAACSTEARDAEERLLAKVRVVRELVQKRRAIEHRRRTEAGDEGNGISVGRLDFGADWADVPDQRVASMAFGAMREHKAHLSASKSMLG